MMTEAPDELGYLGRIPLVGGARRPDPTERSGATYSRMSVKNPTRIEDQQEAELRMLRDKGIPLYDHYADDGISGFKRERRGWLRLKIDAGLELDERDVRAARKLGLPYERPKGRPAPKFTDLATFQGDRLARDHIDFQETIEAMLGKGIKVWDTVWGEITHHNLGIIAYLARQEGIKMSVRTTDALKQQCKRGSKLGDILFGYKHRMRKVVVDGIETWERDKGRYDIDPVAGPIYTEAMRRVARGEGLQETQRWFNGECRRLNVTERIKGEDRLVQRDFWSFKLMLRNAYYMGKVVGGRQRSSYAMGEHWSRPRGEWVTAKEDHDQPLIDEPTWLQVQDILDRRARVGQNRRAPAVNPLSGLLHCAHCGRRMNPHYSGNAESRRRGYSCRVCHLNRSEHKLARVLGTAMHEVPVDRGVDMVLLARQHEEQRAQLEREIATMEMQIQAKTRRRATLLTQRADAGEDVGDYDVALRLTDEERNQIMHDKVKIETILATLARGKDLSEVSEHMARVLTWTQDQGAFPVEEARASLIFCIEKIIIDGPAAQATITWSREVAALVGEREVTVPCAAGR